MISTSQSDLIEVGKALFYTEDGDSTMVKIIAISIDDDNVFHFAFRATNDDKFKVLDLEISSLKGKFSLGYAHTKGIPISVDFLP